MRFLLKLPVVAAKLFDALYAHAVHGNVPAESGPNAQVLRILSA